LERERDRGEERREREREREALWGGPDRGAGFEAVLYF
jgi:hypothetical protein